MTTSKRNARNNHQTPPPAITVAPVTSIIQGPTSGITHFGSTGTGPINIMGAIVKESPPSSPGSESMSSSGPGRRKKKNLSAASTTPVSMPMPMLANNALKEENNVKL